MADRNPIMFGPEWLRKLGHERSQSRPNNPNATGPRPTTAGGLSGNQTGLGLGTSSSGASTSGVTLTTQSQLRATATTSGVSASTVAPSTSGNQKRRIASSSGASGATGSASASANQNRHIASSSGASGTTWSASASANQNRHNASSAGASGATGSASASANQNRHNASSAGASGTAWLASGLANHNRHIAASSGSSGASGSASASANQNRHTASSSGVSGTAWLASGLANHNRHIAASSGSSGASGSASASANQNRHTASSSGVSGTAWLASGLANHNRHIAASSGASGASGSASASANQNRHTASSSGASGATWSASASANQNRHNTSSSGMSGTAWLASGLANHNRHIASSSGASSAPGSASASANQNRHIASSSGASGATRSASASANQNRPIASSSGASGTTWSASASANQNRHNASSAGALPVPSTSGNQNRNTTNNPPPKVLLAKLRYGREEMLALFDSDVDAPDQLKYFDSLYQPRGKEPIALNTIEEEPNMREGIRGGPPNSATSLAERFGAGRGVNRGLLSNTRRIPFIRQLSNGRGWHNSQKTRSTGFSGSPDEETPNLRPWNSSNGAGPSRATPTEQSDWAQAKLFRNRRQFHNTNWRQSGREEGDEWRMQDSTGNRPGNHERDWLERPAQERPQSWGASRRPWSNNHHSDDLPEWATDNPEAGAGTFDSSGAFHGYSNDDSSLPKAQETPYQLARSHTHSTFTRTKTAEDCSEEWWESDKATKLSPKRFHTGDFKYEKASSSESSEASTSTNAHSRPINMDDLQQIPEKLEKDPSSDTTNQAADDTKSPYPESQTFDALMRSDIDIAETKDDRSNFQSVMIAPNNSLRQRHQNIVTSASDTSQQQNINPGILQMYGRQHGNDNELSQSVEEKIVEGMFEMSMLDDASMQLRNIPSNITHQPASNLGMMQQMPPLNTNIQMGLTNPALHNHAIINSTPNISNPTGQSNHIQNIVMPNSVLNSSLGLPMGGTNSAMVLPLQGVMQQAMANNPMTPAMNVALQQHTAAMGPYQQNANLPGMPTPNVANASLFMGQNSTSQMPTGHDMSLQNAEAQSNIFPMHGLQHMVSHTAFNSIYSNVMPPTATQNNPNTPSLADQWYYEDPEHIIQGPFSSNEMFSWHRAGFFTASLMVRRACDTHMRPLGSYGPIVPFAQRDILSSYPLPGFEQRPQPSHEMLNRQTGLGIEEPPIRNNLFNRIDAFPFGIPSPPPPIVEPPRRMGSLWSQPPTSQDMIWMQSAHPSDPRVNNNNMFFWDSQPSAISSNSILPEEIAKEMKTEDEILAQLRASQNIPVSQSSFMNDSATMSSNAPNSEIAFPKVPATPDLGELQKLMQPEVKKTSPPPTSEVKAEKDTSSAKTSIKSNKEEKADASMDSEANNVKVQQIPVKAETKVQKPAKNEADKTAKSKVNNVTKAKSKKSKDDKKDDNEFKSKEDDTNKLAKRSVESSPSKSKKEEKQNKKEIEKEKRELVKDGFTIVKGAEKNNNKEVKKKADEAKAVEEAERKRKEEEKLAIDEEKKKIAAATKKQQEQQQSKPVAESVAKKAPWSAVATQATTTNKVGPTLAEIQRMEREKKLEQMKEQQQMIQIMAQQQAAALAMEEEMEAGLGWPKKINTNTTPQGPTLAEIQAEARRQAATAALAAYAAQLAEEARAAPTPISNPLPWGNLANGGFWDTQPVQQAKPKPVKADPPKQVEISKSKAKTTVAINAGAQPKRETTPAMEFETWCSQALGAWCSKIDVLTFVGFLKDIESPYEVKDYVKCYLGESKESSDFARQFLERRSKLLRVGMVTPSDDLCSPALAINPRNTSASDYQEVKGKGKKTKKNKMMKVDVRILGFSVTAAEDRINVGDIDTA